MAIVRCP